MFSRTTELPIALPPSERPTIVDTFEPFIHSEIDALEEMERAGRDDEAKLLGGDLRKMVQGNLAMYGMSDLIRLEAFRLGLDYQIVGPATPAPSCEPGSNRYMMYPELLPHEHHYQLLDEYAPDVKYPQHTVAIDELRKPRDDRTEPYVLKDTLNSRGVNKLLIDTPEGHQRVLKFLETLPDFLLEFVVLEDFITTPTSYAASFRVTTTPTGYVQAATLIRSIKPKGTELVGLDEVRNYWEALVVPDSEFYVGAKRITSNADVDSVNIPLATERYSIFRGKALDDADHEVMEANGVDIGSREVPMRIVRAAQKVGKVVGPILGFQAGVDIVVDTKGHDWLLEVNANPSNNNTIQGWGGDWDDGSVIHDAVMRTLSDMAHAI